MRISNLTEAQSIGSDQYLVIDSVNTGTKKIEARKFSEQIIEKNPKIEMKNTFFKFDYLGTHFDPSIDISNYFLGNYWIDDGGTVWRIVDFNYYKNDEFPTNHFIVMPDEALYSAQMNSEDHYSGSAYGYSSMRENSLAMAKNSIVDFFGDSHVVRFGDYFTTYINEDGSGSGFQYFSNICVELPNEPMIFGTYIHANNKGCNRMSKVSRQFSLFRLYPSFITGFGDSNEYDDYWLRDVVDYNIFSIVSNPNIPSYGTGINDCGVRPFAVIVP